MHYAFKNQNFKNIFVQSSNSTNYNLVNLKMFPNIRWLCFLLTRSGQ